MNTSQSKSPIADVDQATFKSVVLESASPVVVAFWAPWSRPCYVLGSVLEEVAAARSGSVKVVKANADDNPELSLWYDIQSVPTLLYFVAGNPRARLVGTASKEAIIAKLEAIVRGAQAGSSPPKNEDGHRNL